MAKRKDLKQKLDKKVKQDRAPRVEWKKAEDGQHIPIVFIGNIAMPLAPRPFQGYYKNERDAILVAIKQCLSEVLFGVPCYLVHEKTGKSAKNPDWDLLPFFAQNGELEWQEFEQEPSMEQVRAGNQLPIET